jgi:Uma2 family endonuclease
MSAQPQPRLFPEEYLAIERAAEFKSEYYDGHMCARAGGSLLHSLIAANLTGELRQRLKQKSCRVFTADLRLRVSAQRLYTYPDVTVVCGEPKPADDQKGTLVNPAMIVEVLSPSTEAHDRGFKFAQYKDIESLQEYALVSQSEAYVEIYRRQSDGTWLYSYATGLDSIARFTGLGCDIPLSEIYYQVSFES